MTRYAVVKQQLSEQVATLLEQEIIEGARRVGEQLPSERELMRQFGVGRPAVREALHALRLKGLVEVSSGIRARVTRPTPEVILGEMSGAARSLLRQPDGQRNFEQARSFFEVGLVRYAAEKADDRDLERLRAALEANRGSQGDVDEFQRTDIAFHYVLAEIPRNPIFPAIHNAIAEWLTEQRRTTLRIPGQTGIAYKAHERIYRAIASRSADKAEKAMTAHLGQVFRIYRVVRDEAARGAAEHRAAG